MNPADAIIAEIAWLIERADASSATRRWIAEQRRAAVVLVFRPIGVDAAWRPLFQAGKPDSLAIFTPRTEGVAWLWRAVIAEPVGIVLPSTPEAARGLFRRGLAELDLRCPEIANELRRNADAVGNAIIYTPAVNSPRIEARPICGQDGVAPPATDYSLL